MSDSSAFVFIKGYYKAQDGDAKEVPNKILDYSKQPGRKLVQVYEGESGLEELYKDLKKDEVVLLLGLSHLSSSADEVQELLKRIKDAGAEFVCLHPDEDTVIFSSLTEGGYPDRSSLVKANMGKLIKEGRLRARPPFGYKFISKEKDLEREESQQEVILKIKTMYAEGKGFTAIANTLNANGDNACLLNNKRTVKDKVPIFYAQTVKRILADQGIIQSTDRAPLDKRIISHHSK